MCLQTHVCQCTHTSVANGAFSMHSWLRLVGSFRLQVSLAKEPYKTDYILQARPIILRSLRIVATPYLMFALLYWGACKAVHTDSMESNVPRK